MEKRPSTEVSLPSLLLRKKRRRKVVASSEDEPNEIEQVETTKATEDAEDLSKCGNDVRPVDAKISVGAVSAHSQKQTESAAVPSLPTLPTQTTQSQAVPADTPATDAAEAEELPAEADGQVRAEVTAEGAGNDTPATPAVESVEGTVNLEPPQRKKRDNSSKMLHAARAWLKAPVRRHDATMMERCAALSGLTKKEIADFVAANVNKKPGEWCFTVVDVRITEKKKEQDAIEATIQAEPPFVDVGPSQVQPPEPSLSENDPQSTMSAASFPARHRGRVARPRRRAVQVAACGEDNVVAPDASLVPCLAASEISDAVPEIENQHRQHKIHEMEEKSGSTLAEQVEQVNVPRIGTGLDRRDSTCPARSSKSGVSETETVEALASELSCMEATISSRRRFAPLRPGTKTARSTAVPLSKPQALMPSLPSRPCRHTNVSKKGCAMICESCGEEVLYDGWKLELCDEFDV